MRVVYIGKDSQPVNLAVMSSVNSHSWRRYNEEEQHNTVMNKFPNTNPHDIEKRKNSGTGLQHPYDKEWDFLRRFLVGINGCYNCGQKDHRNTRDCTRDDVIAFHQIAFYFAFYRFIVSY